MILRKPYGFLIKHFKFIHLLLTMCYVFLAVKVNQILTYYNDFISGTASKLDAIGYVTSYYVIFIVLSIVICVIVYALMRYKDKPRLLYLELIVFYLVVGWMISFSYQGLNTIYISILDTKTLRLYRDLLQIMIVVQYLSIIVVLIRGLGFDIKKFNFVQDLEELNIDVSDEEEVELNFGGTQGMQRKVHRRLREFKYYYHENKIFILIILIVVVVLGLSSLVVHNEVIAKEYQEGEVFSSNDFTFQVIGTYVTNRSYDNRMVAKTDTSFVIVKMNLSANGEKKEFNTSNLILKIGQNNYSSNKKYGARFSDLGYVYQGEQVAGQSTYLFIYNIDNGDVEKNMQLIYAGDKTVNLSPLNLDVINKTSEYKLGEDVDLATTVLGSGHLKISSCVVQESFSYGYQYEILGQVYDGSLTIAGGSGSAVLNLEMSSSYPYDYTNYFVLSNYGTLKYEIDGVEYSSDNFADKTPGSYKNGVYVVVDGNVLKASDIWLELSIRGQKIMYVLK